MAPDYLIRPAAACEAGTIVAHRRAMFSEMGYRDEQALDEMSAAFEPWLIARMKTGEYLAWCRDNGIRAVILHASTDRRPLYEPLGFKSTNEMRIEIR